MPRRKRKVIACRECGWNGVTTMRRWGHKITTLPYVERDGNGRYPGGRALPASWRDGVCASCQDRANLSA